MGSENPAFKFGPGKGKRDRRNILADLLSVQYSQLKYGHATHGSEARYAPYYGLEQGRVLTVEQMEERAGQAPKPVFQPPKTIAKGSVWEKLAAKKR